MSAFKQVQQLYTYCRIPCCRWYGNCKDIEHHFNIFHPYQKLSIKTMDESYFEMTFDDLESRMPFLLSTETGVYWFAFNEFEQRANQFSKGIFAIGGSEQIMYHIKLGTLQTRLMEIHGPFYARQEKSYQYDFDIQFDYMDYLRLTMTPKVVIYFGDFDEEADEYDEMEKSLLAEIAESHHDICTNSRFVKEEAEEYDEMEKSLLAEIAESHHDICTNSRFVKEEADEYDEMEKSLLAEIAESHHDICTNSRFVKEEADEYDEMEKSLLAEIAESHHDICTNLHPEMITN